MKRLIFQFYNSSQDTVIKEGTVQSPGRLSCKLPDNLPTFFTYRVAISNDGKTFSEPDHLFRDIEVGDSTQMWPECFEQRRYRSKVQMMLIISCKAPYQCDVIVERKHLTLLMYFN